MDIDACMTVRNRVVLEVIRRHFELYREIPDVEVFIEYFNPDLTDMTMEMVKGAFKPEELRLVNLVLNMSLVGRESEDGSEKQKASALHHYFRFKRGQKDYQSWLSTNENFRKIANLYLQGKLTTLRSELLLALPKINATVRTEGKTIGLIYLSNLNDYIGGWGERQEWKAKLRTLHLREDTLFVETSLALSASREFCASYPPGIMADSLMEANMSNFVYFISNSKDVLEYVPPDMVYSDGYTRSFERDGSPDLNIRVVLQTEYGADMGIRFIKQGVALMMN
ncbi:hypothetical protein IPG41_02260 [Candidatus Peregrinibacteria bacterium]|nr:MAG: hypothetical protein IPG41_02260 [Candidatus Peregrinibacteria bacterium]